MIISASRRTDIPAFYSEWFIKRIKAGYCRVANPYNPNQVRHISLKPGDVDCLVLWTRNPEPMLKYLNFLDESGFTYYFMLTLNNYGSTLEPENPDYGRTVETVARLSDKIGAYRIVWRYDPIILTDNISPEFHIENFKEIFGSLSQYVNKIITSVLTNYRKTERRMAKVGYRVIYDYEVIIKLLKALNNICEMGDRYLQICCPDEKLNSSGIESASCIDIDLINEIGEKTNLYSRDRNQRPGCRCSSAVDIGSNNTCIHGCRYCYATISRKFALARNAKHNPESEFLV